MDSTNADLDDLKKELDELKENYRKAVHQFNIARHALVKIKHVDAPVAQRIAISALRGIEKTESVLWRRVPDDTAEDTFLDDLKELK